MKLDTTTKYVLFFTILIGLSYYYKRLKLSDDTNTSAYYYRMVNKYLLNKNSLGISGKPYLWIHLHADNTIIPDVNSRNWISFKSRNTKEFNQPYQYLTIKSIIDKCSDDFNITLIDDESFKKIIPNWKVDLKLIANPIRTHIRELALANIINIYGGMRVPSSFICFKSLKPLYDANIRENKMFVGEFLNNTSSASYTSNNFLPSTKIMGSTAMNDQMKEYINFLEELNSNDFVAESDFLGKTNLWLNNAVNNDTINNIDGLYIGTKKSCSNAIIIDDLISSTYLDMDDKAFGLYIPWNELIERTAYQWFVRMSPEQILKSDTAIGKRLLVND
jgi:hypothetical protein